MNAALALGLSLLLAVALAGAAAPPVNEAAGERSYQKCYACHDTAPCGNALAGPTLYAVIGRRIAAEPGFNYSPALRALAKRRERWTETLLDRYIADPESLAPGTAMTFTGMRDARERGHLIAYLRTLSPGRD